MVHKGLHVHDYTVRADRLLVFGSGAGCWTGATGGAGGSGSGIATGGLWTGNIRAIRHVLTMRTTEAAEEEICYVFSHIMKRIAELEPNLFGDFEQDEAGFWSPKYYKV